MTEVEYVDGSTWHGRTGGLENSFEYKVGFVLLNLEEDTKGPAFFSRRSGKFFGILDKMTAGIDRIFGPRCKCKKNDKKD